MAFSRKKRFLFHRQKSGGEALIARYHRSSRLKRPLHLKFSAFKIFNLILIVGLLIGLYFFIFSNFYNITDIEVAGNILVSTDDLVDITNKYLDSHKLWIFKNRNFFIFSKEQLKKKINEVVLLQDIKIDKILPNSLKIKLKERDAAVKWLTQGQEYLLSKDGTVIKKFYKITTPDLFLLAKLPEEPEDPASATLLKITNLADLPVNLGDKVLSEQNIDFLIKMKQELDSKIIYKVKSISAPTNYPVFAQIELEEGTKLFFSLQDGIDSQISRLDTLINEKIKKENLFKVDYIDLRLGESVYFKYK